MNFVSALVRDLVAKRLWPLAVLLVAALIAIPFLLGGSGADEGSALPAAAVDANTSVAAAQTAPAVELVGPPSVRSRPGKVRDPFRRPKPKVLDAAGVGSGAPDSPATPGAPSDSTPPDSTPPDSTLPDLTPPDSTPIVKPFAYRTEVYFGSIDAKIGQPRGISRLAPLGGLTEPALVYLGVSGDGKRATFLLGPNAEQNGEGKCSDESCRIIGLKAGTSTIVDVMPAGGETRQYKLDVVSVERDVMASWGAASKARSRVHPDGRDVLRAVIRDGGATAQAMGTVSYAQSLGVLVATSPVASGPAGGTALAP